jgi:hypothetical protein
MDFSSRPEQDTKTSDTSAEHPRAEPSNRSRPESVDRAIHEWRNQLVDLGGRNTLLHYRDLIRGTLDLWGSNRTLWDQTQAFLLGKPVRLSALFQEPSDLADAARRCRVIAAKARENFEERGLDTLYLVFQMATWKTEREGAAPPMAPVLLRPLALRPKGGGAEDFELVPEGAFELNPTLRQNLELEFQLTLPTDEQLHLGSDSGAGALPSDVWTSRSKG